MTGVVVVAAATAVVPVVATAVAVEATGTARATTTGVAGTRGAMTGGTTTAVVAAVAMGESALRRVQDGHDAGESSRRARHPISLILASTAKSSSFSCL